MSLLFKDNPSPLWIVNANSLKILEVNKAAKYIYGFTRGEFLKKSILDLQPEEELLSIFGKKQPTIKHVDLMGIINHKDKWNNVFPVKILSCPTEYNNWEARIIKALLLDQRSKKCSFDECSEIN